MFHVELSSEANPITCPVCRAQTTLRGADIPDHFLSREIFHLRQCARCRVVFTWPQPSPHEMGRYYQSDDYISHSTKPKGVLDRVYRAVRRVTLASKYRIIRSRKPLGALLDIGCGTGHFLQFMHHKGWKVQGIEPGDHAREAAKALFQLDVGTEEELDRLPDKQFDVITMWHVLEHVHDPVARMQQVRRLLKENGLAIIALPNHEARDATNYGIHWAAWDVPRHLFHYNSEAFEYLAKNAGFFRELTLPMRFDAFYVSMLSEQYLHGRKRLISALIKGWRSNQMAKRTGNYSSLIYLLRKQ
jgi:2-polyprenyl-3-methyl-5-hydroxy-6-metoxy-1,4-benzoquinol methylase